MSFSVPYKQVFDPVKTRQNHRKLHTAFPRERSAITEQKRRSLFEDTALQFFRLFFSVLDAEVLLEVFVGSENGDGISLPKDEVCREFQDGIAVSFYGKNIEMELVSDAELSKALADPGFRYFDFKDRIITGVIKIVNNVCGAVTYS